ncbi:UNVERIFIED_CONTAM: hypothetical protein Scaly_2040100 [Sesamum calycinum]|uniref:Uncharacterized protein n=1 Tax=Sesamum calycinum TaxID=2727403 RepID=A0AAW2N1N1_9LAMI
MILQYLKIRLWLAKVAWEDKLPNVLWSYRMMPRTAIGESPFVLSYGTEAMALIEIRELSWQVKHYDPVSNEQGLRMNLDFVARREKKLRHALLCTRPEWLRHTTQESSQETSKWGTWC